MKNTGVIVVGASQAGLAVSYELSQFGIEHVVLERHSIGHGWQQRWDSFCLVTPNWTVQMPGFPYDGRDPDGFMKRDDIVAFLRRYAGSFGAPVIENSPVIEVSAKGDQFQVATDDQVLCAPSLVMATGAFQRPFRPPAARNLPPSLYQIDLTGYKNPGALPSGDVLIVGSGQSGCQLAEELHQDGRRVVLACGRAPWSLRRIGDHDLVWWALESGFLDARSAELPIEARLFANVLTSGHDGGHDLHLRTLQSQGVKLAGRLIGFDDKYAYFADDLMQSITWGDDKYDQLKSVFINCAQQRKLDIPDIPDPVPFKATPCDRIDLYSFGTVIFTGGFRPDFANWLPWPQAFDEQGFPYHTDGSSTVVAGLHFVGLHFLRKRKSALLCGVGEDAAIVAKTIASFGNAQPTSEITPR